MKNNSVKEICSLWDESALRPYLGEVKRRYGYVETVALPNLRDLPPVRIENLFVQPMLAVEQISPELDVELWPDGLSLLDELERTRCIVLLGDPGSGKTTLSNWLTWRLSAGLQAPLPAELDDCLPIPCTLRTLNSSFFLNENVADLAAGVAEKLLGERFSQEVNEKIRLRIASGKYALILDGIDEIPVTQRTTIATWIRQAATDKAFVLATTRIVGYDDFPVHRSLHLDSLKNTKRLLRNINARSVEAHKSKKIYDHGWAKLRFLMPFDNKRIAAFIDNWYQQRCGSAAEAKEKSTDLLRALDKSEPMQNLARTPNLLSLMAIVHRERANLPDGKALLYKEISNAYINTIDQQRKITNHDPLAKFSWETREGWLAYVGFRMQLERNSTKDGVVGAGVLISKPKVIQWLAEAMTLSHVSDIERNSADFLEWIARRSGLLIPRGDDLYAFVHLSFQEYFCGRYLAAQVMSRSFIRNLDNSSSNVTKQKLTRWATRTTWRECLIFFLELISAEQGSDWVDEFVELIFGDRGDFSSSRAKLAARVAADQHIHVNPNLRANLALRSVREGFDEWRYYSSKPDRGVLKHLVETKFTAIVNGGRDFLSHRAEGIVTKSLAAVKEIEDSIYLLIVSGKELKTLDEFPGFSNLRYLALAGTSVRDLSPLKQAKHLKAINVHLTPVVDLSALASCTELTEIDLNRTNVQELSPLSRLKKVRALHINRTSVSDLEPIKRLNLQMLSIGGLNIGSIEILKNMKELFYLDLDGANIEDISVLASNSSLIDLSLNQTPVKDLSPLMKLDQLYGLELEGCLAENPEVIGSLEQLERLSFGLTRTTDISFLENLRNLRELTLHGKHIVDISVVNRLPNLRELNLVETAIETKQLLNINPRIKQITVDEETVLLPKK